MTLENHRQGHCTVIVKQVLRSQGSPFAPELRANMEAGFRRHFGGVRVHTDELAAASAQALGARAYTSGSHIFFAKGRYDPGTREGLWLLAHELAHVVQQRGECPMTAPDDAGADALEHAADYAADVVAAGHSLRRDFAFGAAPPRRHPAPPGPTLRGLVVHH